MAITKALMKVKIMPILPNLKQEGKKRLKQIVRKKRAMKSTLIYAI
jgi:hypothetical protein